MSDHEVIIAGAGGIIGQRLIEALRQRGADAPPITVLTRRAEGRWPDGVTPFVWNPAAARQGDDDALAALAERLHGAHALVNLAGSSIAAGRLDAAHLSRVKGSRVDAGTTLLAAARRAKAPPAVWLQASGVGLYGDRGDELLTEASAPGDPARDVLVPTGLAWEAAAAPAADLTRLVTTRFGVVFDREAEAWRKLLLPVRLFAGGPLGSGRQWMPWIGGRDVARALAWLIETPSATGTFNLTAPEPARQIDVTRAAARALRRPVWLPAPAFALRLALGKVADALLLSSQRVIPERLLEAGFAFEDRTIEKAVPGLV
ncbi:MAG: TIGR01777 family oxidoreductase [Trueperaceae bacterium]|nr:TIGR01777 family oxidoreductase [Trueperaceae bacterium]